MAPSNAKLNMDGSDDPCYRYQFSALKVQVVGKTKMRTSVLENLDTACSEIGRPKEHLITYLGQSLNVSTGTDSGKAYLTGEHKAADLQAYVLKFIKETVLCHHCKNPETSCHVEGERKKKRLYLSCRACQRKSFLVTSEKFEKFLLKQDPKDCADKHAGGNLDEAYATLADESHEPHKKKAACPYCGHMTSKDECRKCGKSLILASKPLLGERSDIVASGLGIFPNVDGLCSLVRRWMKKCDNVSGTSAEDLNRYISSMSHSVDPIETLKSVVNAVVEEACAAGNLGTSELQPKDVSSKAQRTVQTWQTLIEDLHDQVGEQACATRGVVSALQRLKDSSTVTDSTMVGILLCFSQSIDSIDDADLASACRNLPDKCLAMQRFIEFLETDVSDSDS